MDEQDDNTRSLHHWILENLKVGSFHPSTELIHLLDKAIENNIIVLSCCEKGLLINLNLSGGTDEKPTLCL